MSQAPQPGSPDRGPESVLDVIHRNTGEAPSVSLAEPGRESDGSPLLALDPRLGVEFSSRARAPYRVLGEIARGGMGTVLCGHDPELRRDVAIKVLDQRLAGRPEIVQRFVEEAQVGAQLQHPGVVPVYELGLMADERPFFTMKLVRGRTLASLLRERGSSAAELRRFLSIFEQVCQTVAYAHSKGVLHRDLKPTNVMVGAFGEVQVVDWGLAKVLRRAGPAERHRSRPDQPAVETTRSGSSSRGSDSVTGSVLGTPAYMPPEQARGEIDGLDERADVFALGALLCEVLTGSPPYVASRTEAVVLQAARGDLGAARERLAQSGADPALRQLALDCLAPERSDRPATAEAVASAIQEHLARAEERVREAQVVAREARVRAAEERKRRRLAVALAGSIVLVVVIGGLLWTERQREAQRSGLRRRVDELQASALELQGAGRSEEALEKAHDALSLVEAEDLGGGLTERVQAFAEKVRQVASAERERRSLAEEKRKLLEHLNEARLLRSQVGISLTLEDVDGSFREAFQELGLDLEADDLVETLADLRRRGMGQELALALDEWAGTKRELQGWAADGAQALTALANDLDQDPLRAEVREALLRRDAATLLGMQGRIDVATVAPATLWVLAGAVNDVGGDPSALLERAIRLHPDEQRFRLLAGLVHRSRGRRALALRELEAAHVLRPDNAYATERLADLSEELGHFPAALRALDELEARIPDFTPWLGQRADCLLALGRYDEAAEALERLEQGSDLTDEQRVDLLGCRFLAGRISGPELLLQVEAAGTSAHRNQVLALCFLVHPDPAQRDAVRALACAERSTRLDPLRWRSWFALALSSLDQGRFEQAFAALGHLQSFSRQRADVPFCCAAMRALAHDGLGNGELAREWLEQAQLLFSSLAQDEPEAWRDSAFVQVLRAAERQIDQLPGPDAVLPERK